MSFKTYKIHKRLYYNFICDKWTLKHPVDTSEAPDTADETPPSSFGKLADGEDDDNEAPGTSYESHHDGGNYYYNNGFKVISNYVIADFISQSLSDTSESGQGKF